MKLVSWMILGLMALSLTACCQDNDIKKLNVEIRPDEQDLKKANDNKPFVLVVDIVGVQNNELKRFTDKDVSEWFQPNPLKSNAVVYAMTFQPGNFQAQTFSLSDANQRPTWDKWMQKQATHLVIFANFTKSPGAASGSDDPRRFVVPLQCKAWKGAKLQKKDTVIVEINSSGMTAYPPYRTDMR